jgi:hypothetical protein
MKAEFVISLHRHVLLILDITHLLKRILIYLVRGEGPGREEQLLSKGAIIR